MPALAAETVPQQPNCGLAGAAPKPGTQSEKSPWAALQHNRCDMLFGLTLKIGMYL